MNAPLNASAEFQWEEASGKIGQQASWKRIVNPQPYHPHVAEMEVIAFSFLLEILTQ